MTNKDPDKKIEAVDKSREKFAGAYAVLAGKDPDKMSERELRVEVKALRDQIKAAEQSMGLCSCGACWRGYEAVCRTSSEVKA